jgi:hypothetical protein
MDPVANDRVAAYGKWQTMCFTVKAPNGSDSGNGGGRDEYGKKYEDAASHYCHLWWDGSIFS